MVERPYVLQKPCVRKDQCESAAVPARSHASIMCLACAAGGQEMARRHIKELELEGIIELKGIVELKRIVELESIV